MLLMLNGIDVVPAETAALTVKHQTVVELTGRTDETVTACPHGYKAPKKTKSGC